MPEQNHGYFNQVGATLPIRRQGAMTETLQPARRRAEPHHAAQCRSTTLRRVGSCSVPGNSGVNVLPMTDLYFMRNTLLGYIKIGVSSNASKRLRTLESACGMRLELLRVVPSASISEPYLHQIFGYARLKGEWFSPAPALLSLATTDTPIEDFVRSGYAEMVERFYADGTTDAQRYEAIYHTPLDLESIGLDDDA